MHQKAFFLLILMVMIFSRAHAAERLRAYYAHPLSLYGSATEAQDVATLGALGFEVVNPNSPETQRKYDATHDFKIFLDMVAACDIVVFKAFPDGSIPAGVAGEIAKARELRHPVIELPSGVVKRSLTREQTVEYLKDSGSKMLK